MQIVALDKGATSKLFWLIAGVLVAVVAFTARQQDPGVFVAAVLVAAVAIYPFYFWLMGWSQGLPLWPVFALVTGITTALPMVQEPVILNDYTSAEIMIGGITITGFILLGTAVWLSMSSRPSAPPKKVLMISHEHSEKYLFAFIFAGLLFQLNQLAWWIELPGNSMQVVRGVSMSLNTMGIFVLAYYQGRGLLGKIQSYMLAVLTVATALMMASGLILAQAIIPVAMYVLGLALGSGKVPWKAVVIAFCVAAVLHPGKYTMRSIYWGEENEKPLTISTLPAYYWEWLGYGLEGVGFKKRTRASTSEEETPSSIFERGGNIHMLLLVQKKSPGEVPFLNGITYEPIPRLLIPRFMDDQKGISHAGNVMLTVNYGLQTLEQTTSTSIGWGLVPEAYANFGYLGVALLAVFLGSFYGFVARTTIGVPMTSLRFVIGLLVLAASTRADTMGIFITSQFQGMVGVSLAALFLMKRQENPFAVEGANGGQKSESGGRRAEGGKRRAEPSGARQTGAMRQPHSGIAGGRDQSGDRGERGDGNSGGRCFGKTVKGGLQDGREKAQAGLKLTNLKPKTTARMPRRAAPWMTQRMKEQLKGAE